jgi:putative acetyltransferase
VKSGFAQAGCGVLRVMPQASLETHVSPKLALRPRQPDDARDLLVLFNEPDFLETALMRDPFADAGEINAWLDGLQASRRFELVATRDGRCVAFGALYVHGEHFDHCGTLTMGVRSGFRGQGIGAALLRALLATAKRFARLAKIGLTVLVENAPAIRLYRRHGFAIEGLHRRFARRPHGFCDAYSMALLLDEPTIAPSARSAVAPEADRKQVEQLSHGACGARFPQGPQG